MAVCEQIPLTVFQTFKFASHPPEIKTQGISLCQHNGLTKFTWPSKTVDEF